MRKSTLLCPRGQRSRCWLLFQVRFCMEWQSLGLKTHLLAVPFPPRAHLAQYRLDTSPQFGQGILDLRGDLRVDVPLQDADLL